MIFGQGMATTMLQTATAFSSLVNGGTLYKPSIVAGTVDEDGNLSKKSPEISREGVISKETSQLLAEDMSIIKQLVVMLDLVAEIRPNML